MLQHGGEMRLQIHRPWHGFDGTVKDHNASHTEFDPISLEILWSRLISIADESAAALLRTSFSTIVRESNDFATVLMDANGDSLSENTGGIASFNGILPRTLKHFLEKFPRETWKPDDCVITNDKQRTRLFIEGKSPILREKDILTAERRSRRTSASIWQCS